MRLSKYIVIIMLCIVALASCEEQKEHTAPAIHDRDSVSMMTSYGVNTLISDSGVIKYRIVTERWEVNTVRNPSRWIFEKGVFFEQFDEKFHVQSYIQADTAYYYDQKRLWELRSRVSGTKRLTNSIRTSPLSSSLLKERLRELISVVTSA